MVKLAATVPSLNLNLKKKFSFFEFVVYSCAWEQWVRANRMLFKNFFYIYMKSWVKAHKLVCIIIKYASFNSDLQV